MEQAQISAFVLALLVVIALCLVYEVRLRRNLRPRLSRHSHVRTVDFGATYYADPKRAEVAGFVVSRFEELAGVDLAGVLPGNEIVRDLHLGELDSLATVAILTEIEARFSVIVTDNEAARTRTIHELVELISAKREMSRLVG